MENRCKNCGNIHTLSYCNRCGQIVISERFTVKKIVSDIFTKVLDLDRGLFFTFYSMIIRPHIVIKEYVNGITKKYTNPAKYAIYLVAIATFLIVRNNNLDKSIHDINNALSLNENQPGMQMQAAMIGFIKQYMQYFTLLFIPFFALATRWMFRTFNYAEHLIMHCYVYATISIICLPLMLSIQKISYYTIIPMLITFLFYGFIFRKLFKSSILVSFLKGVMFYVIGYLLFFLIFLVGTVIFLLAKKIITGSAL